MKYEQKQLTRMNVYPSCRKLHGDAASRKKVVNYIDKYMKGLMEKWSPDKEVKFEVKVIIHIPKQEKSK